MLSLSSVPYWKIKADHGSVYLLGTRYPRYKLQNRNTTFYLTE
ncbi:hypothetical protein PENVUL_c002G04074 [Penicillium vulpinum]|uniref:Uncharacterized protein n=1 Tax=Penicillium vulpinum TaxID=29845 RepID=A0A1V6SBD0_9EURO|nr:hypothetical protein PENVUL_c002G04074 [Penicillium vulpinum]